MLNHFNDKQNMEKQMFKKITLQAISKTILANHMKKNAANHPIPFGRANRILVGW